MSFISKLLRKTEPLTPPAGLTAPLDARALVDQPTDVPEPIDQEIDPAGERRVDEEARPADMEQTSEQPAQANAHEIAWWEESSPSPPEPDTPPAPSDSTHDAGVSDAPAVTAVPLRPIGGTRPLEPLVEADAGPAPRSAELGDPEGGTRPLSAADVPMLAALRSHRGLAAGALRDVGRVRSANQDSVFALITTLPRESGDVTMGLFVVADGMGGHHGGEIASRLAISTVAHYVLSELVVPALADGTTEALQPLIVGAVQEANRAIWDHAQSIGSDMGTTCTVALLIGRALYIGHVGDSRAYLATPTGLKLITSDHSTVGRLIQLGQLDSSEAREHPLRSQLYRTVGQQPEVAVDYIYQPIGEATHLLMGSDGLWGMLGEDVMLDVLEHTIWPQDACHELIARANLAGGEDNITAIVVSIPSQL
ncbi:MAG TPA: protein phosphatase 2C domain-containing protein [Roseiflexaceae bacterium]|nr:protein phosphatase 2C domain-containing protein [Roseiflexaceae bacterium]